MAATSQDIELQCKRSRKCSKLGGHKGRCNSEKELAAFWETSPVFNMNKRKRELLSEENRVSEEIEEFESTASHLRPREEELENAKSELERKLNEKGKLCLFINCLNFFFSYCYKSLNCL